MKKILFTALVALLLGVNCVTASALEKSENISKEDEEIMEYINIYYLIQNGVKCGDIISVRGNGLRGFLIIMLEHHLAIVSILIQANGSQEMELFH